MEKNMSESVGTQQQKINITQEQIDTRYQELQQQLLSLSMPSDMNFDAFIQQNVDMEAEEFLKKAAIGFLIIEAEEEAKKRKGTYYETEANKERLSEDKEEIEIAEIALLDQNIEDEKRRDYKEATESYNLMIAALKQEIVTSKEVVADEVEQSQQEIQAVSIPDQSQQAPLDQPPIKPLDLIKMYQKGKRSLENTGWPKDKIKKIMDYGMNPASEAGLDLSDLNSDLRNKITEYAIQAFKDKSAIALPMPNLSEVGLFNESNTFKPVFAPGNEPKKYALGEQSFVLTGPEKKDGPEKGTYKIVFTPPGVQGKSNIVQLGKSPKSTTLAFDSYGKCSQLELPPLEMKEGRLVYAGGNKTFPLSLDDLERYAKEANQQLPEGIARAQEQEEELTLTVTQIDTRQENIMQTHEQNAAQTQAQIEAVNPQQEGNITQTHKQNAEQTQVQTEAVNPQPGGNITQTHGDNTAQAKKNRIRTPPPMPTPQGHMPTNITQQGQKKPDIGKMKQKQPTQNQTPPPTITSEVLQEAFNNLKKTGQINL